jgi:hypothetical protein
MPAELPWVEAPEFEIRDALAAPISSAPISSAPVGTSPVDPAPIAPEQPSVPRAEVREIEQRVQALERLLRALLVRLAKSEPDLLTCLDEAFSQSLLSARTDDDKAIDSYAAAVVQAILRSTGEGAEPTPEVADASRPGTEARPGDRHNDELTLRPPAFHYRKVGGIWRLTLGRLPQRVAKKEDDKPARTAAPPGAVTPRRAP